MVSNFAFGWRNCITEYPSKADSDPTWQMPLPFLITAVPMGYYCRHWHIAIARPPGLDFVKMVDRIKITAREAFVN
jgi:hypothetical protein